MWNLVPKEDRALIVAMVRNGMEFQRTLLRTHHREIIPIRMERQHGVPQTTTMSHSKTIPTPLRPLGIILRIHPIYV